MRLDRGLSMIVALAVGLAGCGGGSKAGARPGGDAGTSTDAGGDGGDDQAVLALFQTTTRSGTVQLPAGVNVSLSSLTVQSTVDQQPVSSSGAFTLGTYISPGQIVIVSDGAGNPMLMGWLDATHSIIDADSTAQLFLWLGSGAQSLPYDDQVQLLPTVESIPGLSAVTLAISAALVASPDAFASQNAAVAAAVNQVLAPQMLPTPGTEIPLDVTITSTTPGMQSGLDVLQDGSFSAHIQNAYLRRAWADIRRVSETMTDGQGNTTTTTYSPAVKVNNFEVPPIAGYGGLLPSASQIANYIGGASIDTPWTPVNTPSFSLPLTAGSSQTTYQVTIMGWGDNSGGAFANLDNVQTVEWLNICVQSFFEDIIFPSISSILLGREQVLGGASVDSFLLRVIRNVTADVTGSDTLQPLVKAISQGQLVNAIATVFYNGGDVSTATASNLVRQFIADAFEQALKVEGNVNAQTVLGLRPGVNFLAKLNSYANAAGIFLESANLAAMKIELPLSDNADAWLVNANPDKVVINPNPLVVGPGAMVSATASVLDPASSGNTYRWGNTAANGTLSGPGSTGMMAANGITYYCSSSATATYTANINAAPTTNADTISVDVFAPYTDDAGVTHVSSLCQGQPIGSTTVVVQIGNQVLIDPPSATIGAGQMKVFTAVPPGMGASGTVYSYRWSNTDMAGKLSGAGSDAAVDGGATAYCSTSASTTYTSTGIGMDTIGVEIFAMPNCAAGSSLGKGSAGIGVLGLVATLVPTANIGTTVPNPLIRTFPADYTAGGLSVPWGFIFPADPVYSPTTGEVVSTEQTVYGQIDNQGSSVYVHWTGTAPGTYDCLASWYDQGWLLELQSYGSQPGPDGPIVMPNPGSCSVEVTSFGTNVGDSIAGTYSARLWRDQQCAGVSTICPDVTSPYAADVSGAFLFPPPPSADGGAD